jgi:beta-glucanase (GH16 family)
MTSPYNKGYVTFVKNEEQLLQRIADERAQEEENSDYLTWRDKNAYAPFGAVDLDGCTGAAVKDKLECQQRCTDDPKCDCVTFGFGQCWKRCDCDQNAMTSDFNVGYDTYKKKQGAAEECPPACVKDDTFKEAALEKLKRREDSTMYTTLVWSDDFDGWGIDSAKWDVREDDSDDDINNNELQMYRKDNAYVENGLLRLQAKCEKSGNQNFTSAKLHSRMMFKAGHRVQARLRMSTGNGTWPAFWMMGSGKDPWPMIGEIDILEYVGCTKKVMGNLHTEHRHGDNGYSVYAKEPFEDIGSWHTFQVDWLSDGMIFYIDDERVKTVPAQNCYDDWPYNTNEFFIILNVALGGSLGGQCLLGGQQPSCDHWMEVDWVKVYEIQ